MTENSYLALVHHPIVDKTGLRISAAITALDLHDLARLARTYGLGGVFIQTNQPSQVKLLGRLMGHWVEGFGASYNPNRKEALEILSLVGSVEEAIASLLAKHGVKPIVAATSAKLDGPERLTYRQARETFGASGRPVLILFGTGWGLAPEVFELCDYVIEPIGSPTGYNHLSVRSAASITVDRLFG